MHRGNRHGRSEEARISVLEAADDLLAEKGFTQLTIEGIAQRAGVAKQTIYRWWSSKTEILLDAFLTDAAEDLNPPDTDPRAYLRRLAAFLTRSDAGLVFRALMAEGQHDAVLAERLRTEYLAKQKAAYLAHRKEHDGTLFDRLVGPIYYRALVTGEEITDEFIDELVTATLPPASRA